MGEPTVADAVLDRVLAHLHRIELVGESMRRLDQLEAGADRSAASACEGSREVGGRWTA